MGSRGTGARSGGKIGFEGPETSKVAPHRNVKREIRAKSTILVSDEDKEKEESAQSVDVIPKGKNRGSRTLGTQRNFEQMAEPELVLNLRKETLVLPKVQKVIYVDLSMRELKESNNRLNAMVARNLGENEIHMKELMTQMQFVRNVK